MWFGHSAKTVDLGRGKYLSLIALLFFFSLCSSPTGRAGRSYITRLWQYPPSSSAHRRFAVHGSIVKSRDPLSAFFAVISSRKRWRPFHFWPIFLGFPPPSSPFARRPQRQPAHRSHGAPKRRRLSIVIVFDAVDDDRHMRVAPSTHPWYLAYLAR
jgi:hypothetical protein